MTGGKSEHSAVCNVAVEDQRDSLRLRSAGQTEGGHHDGMSSDDELPSKDSAQLTSLKQDVEGQARIAMEDVVEEFSVLGNVMERLQSWRREEYMKLMFSVDFVITCNQTFSHKKIKIS